MLRSGRIVQMVGQLPVRHWYRSQRLSGHKFKEGLRVFHSCKRKVQKVGVLLLKKELVELASLQRGSEDKIVRKLDQGCTLARNGLPRFIKNFCFGLILSLCVL